jgi:hypothetical protein
LQMVVEAQDDAPSLSQASFASAQDPLPPQPDVTSVCRCSGVVAQISLPPVRDGRLVVDMSVFCICDQDVILSPPWQRQKPPWDVLYENTCGALPPVPPQLSVTPCGSCSYGVHPNSKIEVCVKISGVVVGHNSLFAGDAHVTVCGFLDAKFHMKVVKSVKMKPPEVALLELLSICAMHRSLRQDELCLLVGHQGSQSGIVPSSCANVIVALLPTYVYC